MVLDEQLGALSEDLDQLYDDQFIETCASWVIPYIGDLIGFEAIRGISPNVDNPRAEVAGTISLRRRKGTTLVIEELARDVTAWGAHAREMFQVLGDTQYVKHIRRHCLFAPDLRDWRTGLYVDTAFDRTAHRLDVRSIARGRGRYNLANIAIFLYTQNAYPITASPATPASTNTPGAPLCFRFSSLGIDAPLFHRAKPLLPDSPVAARPENVADRLRRRVLCEDLKLGVGAGYYGPTGSLALFLNGQLVDPFQIRVATLAGPDGSWVNLAGPATLASPYLVALDPELGRIALPDPGAAVAPTLTANYHYGFAADLGGGEYDRASTFVATDPSWILPFPDTALPARYTTLSQALTFAVGELALHGIVALEIATSGTSLLTAPLAVDLPAGATLELRGAESARPTILLDGEITVSGGALSTFVINGLVVAAAAEMAPGSPAPAALLHVTAQRPNGTSNALDALKLVHSTLVPGWTLETTATAVAQPLFDTAPTLIVEPAGCTFFAERSIVGAIRADALASVVLVDSIVDACDRTHVAYSALDGDAGGAALTMDGCTIVGKVHCTVLMMASDSIFWSALAAGDHWVSGLVADRKQDGCVRFSYLPVNARLPRHYECVPQKLAGAEPLFSSRSYGTPDYLKLLMSTDDLIRRGASDGGEMGAYHAVLAPLKESDLAVRLREYLPVGLDVGVIVEN